MQFSIDIGLLLVAIGCIAIGIFVGLVLAHLRSGHKGQAEMMELVTSNKVLEAQLKTLQEAKQTLVQEFENLANRIFDDKQAKFSTQSKEALNVSLSPLRQDIEVFRKQVRDAYEKENADRNKLAGQISEFQKQTLQVSADAVSLANALRSDNKAQGDWGEFVLEKLLEDSGLTNGREYETQVSLKDDVGNSNRPDVIVHLPENRDVVIDSKVSLVAYDRYFGAEDHKAKVGFLTQHLVSFQKHITDLSGKDYEKLEGINSLDFVLMFVPVEAAVMLALGEDQHMMRDAYDLGVIIASPSTLMVTLRTIKNLWRHQEQNSNAQEIAKQAGALHDKFVGFVKDLDKVGSTLETSQKSLEAACNKLSTGKGNIVGRIDKLKALGAKAKKSLPDDLVAKSEPDALEDSRNQSD